jgi:aminopeptidase N
MQGYNQRHRSRTEMNTAAIFLLARSILPDSRPAVQAPLLDTSRYLPAPITVAAEDLSLELAEGAAFAVHLPGSAGAFLLVGRGRIRFTPAVRSEQRQLALFCGKTSLDAAFDAAYVRIPSSEADRAFPGQAFVAGQAPSALARRAGRALETALKDPLAGATLSLSDCLAAVETHRFGRLTYLHLPEEPEDLMLRKPSGAFVALYPSRAHRDAFGLDYGDEYGLPYEAEHYDLDLSVESMEGRIEGRAKLRLRALERLDTAALRLDPGLSVSSVSSRQQGAHEFSKSPGSDRLFVRLDPPLPAGQQITLEIAYGGTAAPQDLSLEGASFPTASERAGGSHSVLLYSNRVWWYPQSPVHNHTTATIRVRIPAGFAALATGVSEPGRLKAAASPDARLFAFRTEKPVRYLSLLVARLEAVTAIPAPAAGPRIRIFTSPDLVDHARTMASEIAGIVHFFDSRIGDAPFPELSVALVDSPLPAAHSPAYLVIIGEPPDRFAGPRKDTPSYFSEEPSFWIAHEIAHQWWGQAVGWRNYRQQWLSEAFAQYFAALYIRKSRGEAAFERVLAWMDRWARRAAGRGPIDLGIRVGQMTQEPWLFPAVVYDRGALVLHMLRGFLGDEAFLSGLKAYEERWKFHRAGTADLEAALERSSGLDLKAFFDRWVRDDGLPDLRWSETTVEDGGRKRLRVDVDQEGEVFPMPLEVTIIFRGSPEEKRTVRLKRRHQEFLFDAEAPVRRVKLNQDLAALCEARKR